MSSPGARRVGLARAISKLGYCSRARAFGLIRDGLVRCNGSVVRNPEAPVRLGRDRIEIEGELIGAAEKIYLMLNKPRGIMTTAADEKGRETVYSLLPANLRWVAPVGRLDQASEGLLLLTNDSEWATRIMDPASHLDKTYHVQIDRVGDARLCEALENGVEMPGGEKLKAKRAKVLRAGSKHSWLEIVLDEGKNRQIRRMLEARGSEALRLVRIEVGPVQLGDLPKGSYRNLTATEKAAMHNALAQSRGKSYARTARSGGAD